MEGPKLPATLDPRRTALLLVDMQNGFLSPGGSIARLGLPIDRTAATVGPARRLLLAFRAAAAPVLFTQTVFRADHADAGLQAARFPPLAALGHLVEGSADAAIVDALAPGEGELVIRKNRFDAFHGTALDDALRTLRVDTLVLAGVATNVCVESTARAAFDRGIEVILPREATASYTREMEEASLLTLGFMFATVAPAAAVAAAIAAGAAAKQA